MLVVQLYIFVGCFLKPVCADASCLSMTERSYLLCHVATQCLKVKMLRVSGGRSLQVSWYISLLHTQCFLKKHTVVFCHAEARSISTLEAWDGFWRTKVGLNHCISIELKCWCLNYTSLLVASQHLKCKMLRTSAWQEAVFCFVMLRVNVIIGLRYLYLKTGELVACLLLYFVEATKNCSFKVYL